MPNGYNVSRPEEDLTFAAIKQTHCVEYIKIVQRRKSHEIAALFPSLWKKVAAVSQTYVHQRVGSCPTARSF